jgi:hypothetical protein
VIYKTTSPGFGASEDEKRKRKCFIKRHSKIMEIVIAFPYTCN